MDKIIDEICLTFAPMITNDQLAMLKNILYAKLSEYDITTKKHEVVVYTSNDELIKMFIVSKKIDGLSDKSLFYYSSTLKRYLNFYIQKPVKEFTKDDLRVHFARRMIENPNISKTSINNERRIFSTFFSWLHVNDYISSNPMCAIKNIKEDKVIKHPFTEIEIEKMRDYLMLETVNQTAPSRKLQAHRNLAIYEFLLSTGCRVSELSGALLKDLDLHDKEIKVFGKGSKERICYLNAVSVMRIEEYLKIRGKDDNPYLFIPVVGKGKKQYIDKSSIESMIREVGEKCGVKAHPHKFRRTCATILLNKGMPIEQVQIVLGHNNLDTTLIYAKTNQKNVKMNHEKFM